MRELVPLAGVCFAYQSATRMVKRVPSVKKLKRAGQNLLPGKLSFAT